MRAREPGPGLPGSQLVVILVVVAVLGFLFVVQIRSQASAQRYLAGQDNVTLGLLINGLSQANNRLQLARIDLSAERDRLRGDLLTHNANVPSLRQELQRLQLVNGAIPAHGPGVEMTIAFTLRDYELEDIANAFRELGVEALAVNGHRIVARTVIQKNGGRLSLDGAFVNAPYVFDAIGDPAALYGSSASGVSGEQAGPVGAETIAATLRSRGNVSLTPEPDLHINAVVPVHPQVYASYSPH